MKQNLWLLTCHSMARPRASPPKLLRSAKLRVLRVNYENRNRPQENHGHPLFYRKGVRPLLPLANFVLKTCLSEQATNTGVIRAAPDGQQHRFATNLRDTPGDYDRYGFRHLIRANRRLTDGPRYFSRCVHTPFHSDGGSDRIDSHRSRISCAVLSIGLSEMACRMCAMASDQWPAV